MRQYSKPLLFTGLIVLLACSVCFHLLDSEELVDPHFRGISDEESREEEGARRHPTAEVFATVDGGEEASSAETRVEAGVRGRVTAQDGSALEGATVDFGEGRTRTDSFGHFRITSTIAPRLAIGCAGYEARSIDIPATDAKMIDIGDIRLRAAQSMEVRIVDSGSVAIPETPVDARYSSLTRTLSKAEAQEWRRVGATDRAGRLDLRMPGSGELLWISVVRPNMVGRMPVAVVAGGSPGPIEVRVPDAMLTTFSCATGMATVALESLDDDELNWAESSSFDGATTFATKPGRFQLSVHAAGTSESRLLIVDSDATVEIGADSTRFVALEVVGEDGEFVPEFLAKAIKADAGSPPRVSILGAMRHWPSEQSSGQEGRARVSVPDKIMPASIVVLAKGMEARVAPVPSTASQLRLALRRAAHVEIGAGDNFERIQLRASRLNAFAEPLSRSVVVDEAAGEQALVLHSVGPGTYEVFGVSRGAECLLTTIELGTADVQIDASRFAGATVELTDAATDSRSWPDIRLRRLKKSEGPFGGYFLDGAPVSGTSVDGAYRFKPVPIGTWIAVESGRDHLLTMPPTPERRIEVTGDSKVTIPWVRSNVREVRFLADSSSLPTGLDPVASIRFGSALGESPWVSARTSFTLETRSEEAGTLIVAVRPGRSNGRSVTAGFVPLTVVDLASRDLTQDVSITLPTPASLTIVDSSMSLTRVVAKLVRTTDDRPWFLPLYLNLDRPLQLLCPGEYRLDIRAVRDGSIRRVKIPLSLDAGEVRELDLGEEF